MKTVRRMSEFEVRAALVQLATLIDEVDNVTQQLEATPQCIHMHGDFDSVAAMRVKLQDIRAAHGYTRTGVLKYDEPETPFPELETVPADLDPLTIPAPRGWNMIEGGLEAGQLPALLQHQAA